MWWSPADPTDTPRDPSDDDSLPAYGVGLVDVARPSPPRVRPERFDVAGFIETVETYAPRWIGFNGKRAATIVACSLGHRAPPLGRAPWRIANAQVFVLPSSGGANRRRNYDGRPTRLTWWLGLSEVMLKQTPGMR